MFSSTATATTIDKCNEWHDWSLPCPWRSTSRRTASTIRQCPCANYTQMLALLEFYVVAKKQCVWPDKTTSSAKPTTRIRTIGVNSMFWIKRIWNQMILQSMKLSVDLSTTQLTQTLPTCRTLPTFQQIQICPKWKTIKINNSIQNEKRKTKDDLDPDHRSSELVFVNVWTPFLSF